MHYSMFILFLMWILVVFMINELYQFSSVIFFWGEDVKSRDESTEHFNKAGEGLTFLQSEPQGSATLPTTQMFSV